jgi:multiple sugar transport system permease protein/cellobiose transport system permease protein
MNKIILRIFIYAILIAITLVMIQPFFFMVLMSTYRTQQLGDVLTLRPGGHLMENLKTVLASGFMSYYWNSIKAAVVFNVLSVFLCALAGYGFAKFQFKGKKALYTFVLGSMMIPAQLGLIGYVVQMRRMHLIGTLWPIILGDIASCFGVFWMTQYITSSVPKPIMEAARMDGCSEFRLFFQIVMPIIRPALATLGILQFVFSWNYYLRPMMTISNPDLYTIPLGIASLSTRYQTNYAAQITALALGTIPTIIIFILGARTFISSLTSGAVKG